MTRAAERHYAKSDRQQAADDMYVHVGKSAATNVADVPVSIKLRGIVPDDTNFIIDSWADSYRHSPDMRGIDADLYKIEIRALIYGLLPKAKFLVACEPGNERNIRGWVCYTTPTKEGQLPVVHYLLVKPDMQNRGIATSMLDVVRASSSLDESPIFITARTFPIIKWFAAKRNLIWNPFLGK